jgi:hypothetical protein
MAYLHHSIAALRIRGDSLKPDAVSRLLCCSPTLGCVKGKIVPSRGRPSVRETGAWHLDSVGQQPGNLGAHVAELFSRVNNDAQAWTALSGTFETDLLCIYFSPEPDEVVEASAETLKILGERGIKLRLRIYSPTKEDENESATGK